MPQVDTRTAAERREYMRGYHLRRKMNQEAARTAASASVDARGVINGFASRYSFMGDGEMRQHYLRDGSGRMMWPERSRVEPEDWETTLARVR
jgi:hypothetical protein